MHGAPGGTVQIGRTNYPGKSLARNLFNPAKRTGTVLPRPDTKS